MEKLKKIITCKWLLDWFFDVTDKIKKKGFIGSLIAYLLFIAIFLVITIGLLVFIALFYALSEALGIYHGMAKVFIAFVVPIGIGYVLHEKPWFWVANFLIGIISILYFITQY